MTSAANQVFDQHAPQVYAWAYRVLGRHHDALDVVQDVFLKWNAQCGRQPPLQPRGWLRTITLNRAIDLRRRAEKDRALTAAPFDATTEPAILRHPSAETALEREELREHVRAALEDLTEMQRAVVVAKVFDDLTFARIAEELEVSVSTAKTHFLRGIRSMRDRLDPNWNEENQT
jgi:RNA polymerase sigma-70 factor (ECF subfamily)